MLHWILTGVCVQCASLQLHQRCVIISNGTKNSLNYQIKCYALFGIVSHSSVKCIFFFFNKWKYKYTAKMLCTHSSWCSILFKRSEIAIIFGSFNDRVCKLTFAMFSFFLGFLQCNWFSKCTKPTLKHILIAEMLQRCLLCSLFQKWVNCHQKCLFKTIFLNRSNSKFEPLKACIHF